MQKKRHERHCDKASKDEEISPFFIYIFFDWLYRLYIIIIIQKNHFLSLAWQKNYVIQVRPKSKLQAQMCSKQTTLVVSKLKKMSIEMSSIFIDKQYDKQLNDNT